MRIILLPIIAATLLTSCNSSTTKYSAGVVKESYIHKYGVAVSKEEWNERGRDGKVVTTKQDGIVITQVYRGGILEGDTTITFPHSRTVETLQTYFEGNLVRQVVHYPTGMPKEEERYTTDQTRILTTWYESGTPKSVETQQGGFLIKGDYYAQNHEIETRVANGKGTRTLRDPYGQLVSRDRFTNGYLAAVTTYHPNGTPKEVTPFDNGKIHGSRKTFFASGQPNSVESWLDGQQVGVTLEFRNGEKIAEVPYVTGQKNGIERRFNGEQLVEEVTWVAGRQQGVAKSYIDGVANTSWYHNGKVVSKGVYDDLKGALR